MDQKQQIMQCINDCQSAINEIQSLANQATDQNTKATLMESAHHVDMCVRECDWASTQIS